jgi:hypothetical protein
MSRRLQTCAAVTDSTGIIRHTRLFVMTTFQIAIPEAVSDSPYFTDPLEFGEACWQNPAEICDQTGTVRAVGSG